MAKHARTSSSDHIEIRPREPRATRAGRVVAGTEDGSAPDKTLANVDCALASSQENGPMSLLRRWCPVGAPCVVQTSSPRAVSPERRRPRVPLDSQKLTSDSPFRAPAKTTIVEAIRITIPYDDKKNALTCPRAPPILSSSGLSASPR